jgi:hypothetical protein
VCSFHCLPFGDFYELASNWRRRYAESHNRCYYNGGSFHLARQKKYSLRFKI